LKVTLKDVKAIRSPLQRPRTSSKPARPFSATSAPSRLIEDRKIKDRKDKDKKKYETELERRRRVKLEKGHRAKDATQKGYVCKIDDDSAISKL
jgi:hypothetical protein